VSKVMSQRTVEAARAPKEGRLTKADGIVPGLQFIVHSGGKKSFRLIARIRGKQVNLEIGDASILSLADARAKAKRLLGQIAEGIDPREAKQEAVKVASETVAVVARRFVERHAKAHTRRWEETERQIEKEIIPVWGRRPISSIGRADVAALIDGIADRGAPVMANRVFATARKMFSWACERGTMESSPFDRLKAAPAPETKRDRTHNDAELALIWEASGALGYPFGPLVLLLILTGCRREEVAGMRWSELHADRSLWVVPAERVKNGIQHSIPLSSWARSIIAELPRFIGSDLVFTTTGTTSVSGYSRFKRVLDDAVTELNGGTPIPPWTLHDCRRSVASGMAKLGIHLPVIERILNHNSGPSFGGVAGIYQRHSFEDEKRAALEAWAQHLLSLNTGSVVALRA
jgi:integrase